MSTGDAYAAVVRLRALLSDLDLSRRVSDLAQVIGAARAEAQTALEALEADIRADHPGAARSDARRTSQEAALAVRTGTARARVLIALRRRGPLTDRELQDVLRMPASTERPRRGELVRAGYVTPHETTREHDGRAWTVWGLTLAGLVMARTVDTNPGASLTPAEQPVQGTLI